MVFVSLPRWGGRAAWLLLAACLLALLALTPASGDSGDGGQRPDARHQAVLAGAGVSELVATEHLRAQLVAERGVVVPGASVDLALVFDIRPHWHTYWKNPGDSGEPPRLTWNLPEGVTAGPIQWTYPSLIRVGPLANYGYSGRALHLIPLSVSADWPAGEPIEVRADATWLVCEEHCIPEEGAFELRLRTVAEMPSRSSANSVGLSVGDEEAGATGADDDEAARARLFADARARLPSGGRVAATLERGKERMRLRVPVAALPPEPTSIAFFADEWGLLEHAAPQSWQIEDGWLSMTLVPGEAPASAVPVGLLVVEHAGGTDALPVDASVPTAEQAEDPTGSAIGAPEDVLGDPGSAESATLGLPLAIDLAPGAPGSPGTPIEPEAPSDSGAPNSDAAGAFGGKQASGEQAGGKPVSGERGQGDQSVARQGRQSGPPSMPFSSERLAAAREAERPVFVNMTAAWCITCLVNERVALSRSAVVETFAARDLLYLKGDWTNRDARISDYLAGFGRSGVPLYVYYPPGAEPQVLPQVLTESIVLDALQPTMTKL